jgi:hypothetical protein
MIRTSLGRLLHRQPSAGVLPIRAPLRRTLWARCFPAAHCGAIRSDSVSRAAGPAARPVRSAARRTSRMPGGAGVVSLTGPRGRKRLGPSRRPTRGRHPDKALPDEVDSYFTEMGRIAVDIGNSVTEVVLSGDPDRAAELDDYDMDSLHRHVFSVLMDRQWNTAWPPL